MKIKMMDPWMQIEGRKPIFIMNFSALDFFKFASRMPQIAQILVSTFKIVQESMPLDPTRYFLFFFSLAFQALVVQMYVSFLCLNQYFS